MVNQPADELTKRMLIRTWPAYAARQSSEMTDQFIDAMCDDLPRYAEVIQAKVPQLWPWLVERSKMTVDERKAADAVAESNEQADPDAVIWLADLIELYLVENPQDKELYDFALHHQFKHMSDDELKVFIASVEGRGYE